MSQPLTSQAGGQEEAPKAVAQDAVHVPFAVTSDGQKLYSAVYAAQMKMFAKNHPSQSPSERATAETKSAAQATCIVRRMSPKNSDAVTAEERAVIEMITRDLAAGHQIEDPAVGQQYGRAYFSCAQNPLE